MAMASRLNAPGESGFRMLPVPGEVFTEIEAIRLLTGTETEMVAAGGVGGAEGAICLALNGSDEKMEKAEGLIKEVAGEPGLEL
jgi:hypothetical protein